MTTGTETKSFSQIQSSYGLSGQLRITEVVKTAPLAAQTIKSWNAPLTIC